MSLQLARKWEIGQSDIGKGMLIAISKHHRRLRIQTGDGILDQLTNEQTAAVIAEQFIPSFREANYFDGTKNGLDELMRILREQ